MRPLSPLHCCSPHLLLRLLHHRLRLLQRASAGRSRDRAAGGGLRGGGEKTHPEQATDAGTAKHHAPFAPGRHGYGPAEASRGEAARGRPRGDPEPGRNWVQQRGAAGGELGDHQLRRER